MNKIVYLFMALYLTTAFTLDIIAQEKRSIEHTIQEESELIEISEKQEQAE